VFENQHVVYCANHVRSYYRDRPRKYKGDLEKSSHLRDRVGVINISVYLKNNPNVIFCDMREYHCNCYGGTNYHPIIGSINGKLLHDSPLAESIKRRIHMGKHIRNVLVDMMKRHPDRFQGFSPEQLTDWLVWYEEPYLLFYIHNKTFLELASSDDMTDSDRQCVQMLCAWFEDNRREDWDEADELLARGKINSKHFNKLFRPGELFFSRSKEEGGLLRAFKMRPYPWNDSQDRKADNFCWTFNGLFQEEHHYLDLHVQRITALKSEDGEEDINSLLFYPLRFAEPGTRDKLVARGLKFWSCRKQKLICHLDPGSDGLGQVSSRTFAGSNMEVH
jgi:hypothetical protein